MTTKDTNDRVAVRDGIEVGEQRVRLEASINDKAGSPLKIKIEGRKSGRNQHPKY